MIGYSLRKSILFLVPGLGSYVVVLMTMRAFASESFFQPQSDFGIPIGAAIVALIMIVRNIVASNGNHQ